MSSSENKKGFAALSDFSMKRPITISMIFFSMVVIGLIAAKRLPLEQWPQLNTPRVTVNVSYPSSTPKEVEQNITRPLEEAISTIGDIEAINSESNTEGSVIRIQFKSDADIDEKAMLVKEQIDLTRPQLPDDIRRVKINKADFGMGNGAIMELRLTGDLDLENSYDVVNKYLVRPIERVPGVARVDLQGLEPKELRIIIDSDALKMYGIGFNELVQKIRSTNFTIASGNFKTGYTEDSSQLRVVPKGQIMNIDEFNNILLNTSGVRLSDVATIKVVNGERNYARHLDRKYSVGLEIYNESTSNLVDVADRVLEKIEEISKTPQMKGIKLVFLNNQAQSVRDSLKDVIMSGIIGSLLSLIVLYIFIRDIQTTLIVSLSIPISIAITLGILYFLGLTLNILSLMGLMLAIGMLVDNSVVISESIFTRKSSGKFDIRTSISKGVSDVMLPVIAGTSTSICVFLPIIFGGDDMFSVMLSHVAASIIAALVVSLFLSITVVPLIISVLNKNADVNKPHKKIWFDSFKHGYSGILSYTMKHRWITFFSIVIIIVFGIYVQKNFIKSENQFRQNIGGRDFWLPYHVDGSFTLERLKKDVDKVENFLYENKERFDIDTVYSYYSEDNFTGTRVYLVDEDKATRPVEEIKKEIIRDMPKITIGKPSFRFGRGRGSDGMSVYLKGDSQEVMRDFLPPILLELNKISGVVGAQVEDKNDREELRVVVNRERARRLGIDATAVAQSVNIAMRGMNLRDIVTETGEMQVIVRFYEKDEFKIEQLLNLPIKTSFGNQVTLDTVADVINTHSAQKIFRHNRIGALQIDVDLEDNVNRNDIQDSIKLVMNNIKFPSGYDWSFDDETRRGGVQFNASLNTLGISIVLIFIVMAAMFESLLFPLCVISSILFSFLGVVYFFAITKTEFSIMAVVGMIILVGVVVNNGIVLIDHINQLRIQGLNRREAVLQAGRDRLRPILMTALTTVVGLIPLAVSVSQVGGRGPAYFPMARAIIGGLTFSTIISLLVLPSLYCWLDDLRFWARQRVKTPTLTKRAHKKSAIS